MVCINRNDKRFKQLFKLYNTDLATAIVKNYSKEVKGLVNDFYYPSYKEIAEWIAKDRSKTLDLFKELYEKNPQIGVEAIAKLLSKVIHKKDGEYYVTTGWINNGSLVVKSEVAKTIFEPNFTTMLQLSNTYPHIFELTQGVKNIYGIHVKINPQTAEVTKAQQQVETKEEIVEEIVKDEFTKIKEEGSWNIKNGEIITIHDADEDFLIATAGETIAKNSNRLIRILTAKLTDAKIRLNNSKNQNQIFKIAAEINDYTKRLEEAERNEVIGKNVQDYYEAYELGRKEIMDVAALLGKNNISIEELNNAQSILSFWESIGNYSGSEENHPLLTPAEADQDEILELFNKLSVLSRKYKKTLDTISRKYLEQIYKDTTGKTKTADELLSSMEDINSVSRQTLWLGEQKDSLLQLASSLIEQTSIKPMLEVDAIWKKLDELSKKALPKLKSLSKTSNPYDALQQLDTEGNPTGRVVYLITDEYFKTLSSLRHKAFRVYDKDGSWKKNKDSIKEYYDFQKNNSIYFDPRILIPDSSDNYPDLVYKRVQYSNTQRDAHIAELKSHLGDHHFTIYYERVKKKIDRYQAQREAKWLEISNNPNLNGQEQKIIMEDWLRNNSPYWYMDMQENPAMRIKTESGGNVQEYYKEYGVNYTYSVPKRTIEGKKTKWYDQNYEKIAADKDMLAFHDYYIQLMSEFSKVFPQEKKKLLGINSVPTVDKTLAELFSEKGLALGYKPFMDKFKKLISTPDLSQISIDDQEKQIQTRFIIDERKEIDNRVRKEVLHRKNVTGILPSQKEVNQIRKEKIQELMQEKSWDLVRVMKAFTLEASAYKYKAQVDGSIRLIHNLFQEREEVVFNKAKKPMIDPITGKIKTKKVSEGGLQNTINALEYLIDAEHYNLGSRKVEGATDKKVYTESEQKQKQKLEETLENTTSDTEKEYLEEELKKLGSVVTGSGVGDTILKTNLLLSLGFNIPSAINNLVFGMTSNYVEASDGRLYTTKELNKAYYLALNSVGKNVTLGAWEGVGGMGIKIRNLMDKFDLLKTSVDETYDSSTNGFRSITKLGPMTLQQTTEYLNNAPVMIAIMENMKAKDPEGKEVSLFEAYDNQGKLKEGFVPSIEEVNLVQKVRAAVVKNHGDYYHTLEVKKTILGRAFTQFRTWAFSGFYNRFRPERVNEILSYGGEQYIEKGRYRSYSKGQLVTTGAAIGTLMLPGIGTLVGAGVGIATSKFTGVESGDSVMSDTLFTLKQLFRKATFRKTQFNEKFTPEDAANMRKNMTELYVYVALYLVVLGLKHSIDDEDEKDNFATVMLINQGNRLVTDIEFYTNPLSLEKITKSALPATRLLEATSKWAEAVAATVDEDEDNDIIQQGPFKDWNKLTLRTMQLTPFTKFPLDIYKTGSMVFEKD